jgi:ABC-type Fe3+-hydroxamate transport system substrate-binding protein
LTEEQVKALVEKLLELKPDLVITEKGVSGTFYLILSLHSSFRRGL